MNTKTRKLAAIGLGLFAVGAILAASVVPASAHATRHHHKHAKVKVVKPKVKVNINLGGGYGHTNVIYRPAPVVYIAPRPTYGCYRADHDGWYNGHTARVSHRYCYNAYGNPVAQSGSKRLVHYY